MKASDFFKSGIKDNNYTGYTLDVIDTPWYSEHFNCSINKESDYSSIYRQNGIRNFLLDLFNLIASKDLSDINIAQINFDEEFEANKNQKIFELTGDSFDNIRIYTGNIVGSIISKGYVFNINCRFGNEFLQYMIASTSGFLELENFGAIDKNLGLGEWILIYYWKIQLRKAFAVGIYKTYKKKNENLLSVRGNIDINAILKKDYFDGKTACNFKEHSYDNVLNSVISMALTKVFKSKYQAIVTNIYNIKNAFDSINTKQVNLNQVSSHKVINPYFVKYNEVFNLSLNILKDEFANIGNSSSEISAFLFDISLLFEHHIRKLIKRRLTLLPKNIVEFWIPNGIKENKICPDIVIDYGDNKIGIYDVKYKHFQFQGKDQGVERNDRFQLTSYVALYLAKYEVIECGIIYPLKADEQHLQSLVNEQQLRIGGKEIPFHVKFYLVQNDLENQPGADKDFLNIMIDSQPRHFGL